MAPFILLLALLSQVASDSLPVEIGKDAHLPCEVASSIIKAVEWTKHGMTSHEYVLFYSDGHSDTTHQHSSYVGRVCLQDKYMKNGNVSLTLRNVSHSDMGTYECRVSLGGRHKRANIDSQPIKTIKLTVKPSDPVDNNNVNQVAVDRNHILVGLVVFVCLSLCVGLIYVWKRSKDKNSDLSSDDKAGDEQPV